MIRNRKLKVFLCYSKVDKLQIDQLYWRLMENGFDAWLDDEELVPGQEWDIEIQKAIGESDVVLICLSTASIEKTGYLQKEIRSALDIADKKPEGTIYIIPTKLDECKIPDRLSKWQWVNLYEINGYEKLILSLHQLRNLIGLPQEQLNSFSHIALWGTTGSGKTWLLRAFSRELFWFNENYQDFQYSLKDADDDNLLSTLPPDSEFETPATQVVQDYLWIFSRNRIKNAITRQTNLYKHKLIVHDGPGGQMIDMVENRSNYDERIYFSTYKSSDNIIVLLDPTNVKDSPVARNSDYSKNDYIRWLETLIEIGLKEKSHLRVAVCLGKADLIKSYLPTEELIKAVFGDTIINVFNSPEVSSKFFRISSVGITTREGKREPNITNEGELKDKDNWNPINVVSPFFWIFEESEREQFIKVGERIKYNTPYPQPRLIFPE